MAGLMIFTSVAEAIRAGYQIIGTTPSGYLARTRLSAGWALAIVEVAK